MYSGGGGLPPKALIMHIEIVQFNRAMKKTC